ncbi:MAG: DNA-3-methyladenine glycosylase [Candidatus Bathyarchaeota archaeon]|nr:MAG: DNA-3-methyladenine glycosylase [Candidatus Bathyarchaeota archaeon]
MDVVKPLPRSFYNRDTLVVAQELLGKLLIRRFSEGCIVAKIVEVEAYRGRDDPASHAYRGETPRNLLMFGKPGFAYVYFIYGNHYCLNVTSDQEQVPGAVLIRSVEVIEGSKLAYRNRKAKSLVNLSNGPGKLTQALDISKTHNGLDLTKSGELFISTSRTCEKVETMITKRIGIRAGIEKPWRFYIRNSAFVSRQ